MSLMKTCQKYFDQTLYFLHIDKANDMTQKCIRERICVVNKGAYVTSPSSAQMPWMKVIYLDYTFSVDLCAL